MSYWVITADHIGNGERVGFGFLKPLFEGETTRHRTCDLSSKIVKNWVDSLPCKFRLFDDDGELYYEGASSEADFDAQDWAERNDGVTYTMVKTGKDSEWQVL